MYFFVPCLLRDGENDEFAARDVQLYSTRKMRSTLNISEICSPKNPQFWIFRFRWVLLIKGPFWSSERYIFNSVINKKKKKT